MQLKESIKDFISNFYVYAYGLLFALLPILLSRSFNEHYEFPKLIFLYISSFVLLGIYILDVWLNGSKSKPISKYVFFYIVTFLLSIAFSTHLYTSVFGYYSRFNGGLLSFITYFILFWIAVNRLSRENFVLLIKVSFLMIIYLSIHSLSQYFGYAGVWPYPALTRAFSTFGQPNWLAQYLSMLLPLAIAFGLREKNILWFIVFGIGYTSLWVSFSVSGFLAFLIALSLVIVSERKLMKERVNTISLLFLLLFCISFSIANTGIFTSKFRDALREFSTFRSEVVAYSPGDYEVSDPGYIRTNLWKGTLSLILSSPRYMMFGSGPGTFAYVFQEFRPVELNQSSEWFLVHNKPHNYFLEIWVEMGFVGLVFYLVLIFQFLKKSSLVLMAPLISFMITNFFGWPVVATQFLFWMLLAYIVVSRGREDDSIRIHINKSILMLFSALLFVIFGTSILVYFTAELNYSRALKLYEKNMIPESKIFILRAIKLNGFEPEYHLHKSRVFLYDVPSNLDVSYSSMHDAIGINPGNLVTLRGSLPLYYSLASTKIPQYEELTKTFFSYVKIKYWNDVGTLLTIAALEKELSYPEYINTKERIIFLREDFEEWHQLFVD